MMGGFKEKKRIIWSFRPQKCKQSWHKDGLLSTKCISFSFSVCLAFLSPPFTPSPAFTLALSVLFSVSVFPVVKVGAVMVLIIDFVCV